MNRKDIYIYNNCFGSIRGGRLTEYRGASYIESSLPVKLSSTQYITLDEIIGSAVRYKTDSGYLIEGKISKGISLNGHIYLHCYWNQGSKEIPCGWIEMNDPRLESINPLIAHGIPETDNLNR